MNFGDTLRAQPKIWLVVEAFVLVTVLGFIDYSTTFEVSLFVFYAVPILLLAWHGDRRMALAFAFACGFVWFFANWETHPYKSLQAYFWATINRLAYFIFVAIGGTAMRNERETIRGRLETLERTRELEHEIVRVSEREQRRIGQDLHDGLCQHLAAIGCAASCLKDDLDEKSLPEAEAANFIQKQLEEAVVEARDLARGIFPVQMDGEGFPAALEELAAATNRLRTLSVRLEIPAEIRIEDPEVGMHLYRIAQEALSNAAKHAEASEVDITLARNEHLLKMTIADNGKGIVDAHAGIKGMGLRTMSYRARSMGGELEVENNPSGGTLISCSVPVDSNSNSIFQNDPKA